jgi:hypothetical protein
MQAEALYRNGHRIVKEADGWKVYTKDEFTAGPFETLEEAERVAASKSTAYPY